MNLIHQFELSIARIVLSVFAVNDNGLSRAQGIAWLRGEAQNAHVAAPIPESCFGLLENYSSVQLEEVIDMLLVEGLLETPQNDGPLVLHPTTRGYAMMVGRIHPVLPVSGLFEKRNTQDFGQQEMVVYKSLQKLRARVAYAEHLHPHQICHDSVLRKLCRHLPSTQQELLAIEGITTDFVQRHGHKFLRLLQSELVAA